MYSMQFVSPQAVLTGTNADTLYVTNPLAQKVIVQRAYVVDNAGVTADGSNYVTVQLRSGTTVLASVDTSSASLTAGTPAALTLSGTGSDLEIDAGGALNVNITKAGSGVNVDLTVAVDCLVGRDIS